MINANTINAIGPAIHPSCVKLHANDSTPDPRTPVIMCATAVPNVPDFIYKLNLSLVDDHQSFN